MNRIDNKIVQKISRKKNQNSILEKQVRRTCEGWLNVHDWLWWPMPIGPVIRGRGIDKIWTKNPLKGFPDDCGILKPPKPIINPLPIFWAAEFKRGAGGRVSPEQSFWHEKLRSNGVHVLIASNFEMFQAWLLELQKYYYK